MLGFDVNLTLINKRENELTRTQTDSSIGHIT